MLLWIDPLLALVSLATAPLLVVRQLRLPAPRARRRRACGARHEGQIASVASEALSAMAVVKAFGSEGFESDRVRDAQRAADGAPASRSRGCRRASTGSSARCGRSARRSCSSSACSASPHGAIAPGELIVFVSYTRKAHEPDAQLRARGDEDRRRDGAGRPVAELLAADEVLEERPGAYRGGRASGDVALEDVSFGYGAGRGPRSTT